MTGDVRISLMQGTFRAKVAVVDPITGRKDCSVDSDRDGIDDNADLCPGTPSCTVSSV